MHNPTALVIHSCDPDLWFLPIPTSTNGLCIQTCHLHAMNAHEKNSLITEKSLTPVQLYLFSWQWPRIVESSCTCIIEIGKFFFKCLQPQLWHIVCQQEKANRNTHTCMYVKFWKYWQAHKITPTLKKSKN